MRHAMFEGLDGSGREDSIGRDSSGASYTERGDEPPRGAAWFDCLKKVLMADRTYRNRVHDCRYNIE